MAIENLETMVARAVLAESRDRIDLLGIDGSLKFSNLPAELGVEASIKDVRIGQSWPALWPEAARALATQAIAGAAGGERQQFVAAMPSDKGELWWNVAVSPIVGLDGAVTGLLSIAQNISHMRETETALQTSEQRFRGLTDNMAQLAFMADADGRIFWFSQRWIGYTGVAQADLAEHDWLSVHHPDYRQRIKERFSAALANRQPWEDEVYLRAQDGNYRWFLSRAVPVSDDNGNLALWCATFTDITEQRNLSHRLRQLARVVELSHEAILVWDLDGGIVLWNNGCEDLYGYTRTEALGRTSHELLATEHPHGLDDFLNHLRKHGEWSGEICHRAKDGGAIWVDSRQEIIRAGGRNLVIETNRDTTERRQSDEIRELLMAELNHRVKNTLAIVQSIASQMARSQISLPEFMGRFSGVIQSLAISQNVLSDAHWHGAELTELVRSQVTMVTGTSDRFILSGPSVMVPPELAVQLSLIIHELSINAAQHGALTRPEGEVSINWVVHPPPRAAVALDWLETGGPPVSEAGIVGFGRRLIERTGRLPHISSELHLRPEGANCRITLDFSTFTPPARGYFRPDFQIKDRARPRSASRSDRMAGRRILLIVFDALESHWLEEILSDADYLIVGIARTLEAAHTMIETKIYDIAIVDRSEMPLETKALLQRIAELGKRSVVLAAADDTSIPGEVLKKPLEPQTLISALRPNQESG